MKRKHLLTALESPAVHQTSALVLKLVQRVDWAGVCGGWVGVGGGGCSMINSFLLGLLFCCRGFWSSGFWNYRCFSTYILFFLVSTINNLEENPMTNQFGKHYLKMVVKCNTYCATWLLHWLGRTVPVRTHRSCTGGIKVYVLKEKETDLTVILNVWTRSGYVCDAKVRLTNSMFYKGDAKWLGHTPPLPAIRGP